MIRVTVNLDTITAKALHDLNEKFSQLTPEQRAEFERSWLEIVERQRRDIRSGRWLEEAIAAYQRRTGHEL